MALTQSHFRFGIDELAENTHGWYANEDTNPAQGVIAVDVNFLLRFCVQANATGLSNVDNEFQYRLNGGTWTNITTTSSVVKAVAVTPLTNGGNCTKRLSGTGTFESSGAGQTEDGTSGGSANDIVASGNSETECGLQIVGADVANGDVIEFRLTRDGGVLLDTYAVTPSITVQKTSTYNDSVTEAASSSGSPSATAVFASSLTESAAASETQTGGLLLTASVTESAAASESQTSGLALDASQTDSVSAGEAPSALASFAGAQTDSVSAGEAPSALASFSGSQTDSVSAGEAPSALAVLVATQAETASSSDSPGATAVFPAALTESLSASEVSDGATQGSIQDAEVVESVSAQEIASAQVVLLAEAVEVVGLLDAADAAAIFMLSVAEAAIAGELCSVQEEIGVAPDPIHGKPLEVVHGCGHGDMIKGKRIDVIR